ncbi:MAG: four helix bundle protein [Bacteroidia bacterium]
MKNRNNHNFRKLKIWSDAIDLVVELYKETAGYPSDEKYGLISQIQRAGVSIPANIAEGSAKGTNADFVRFLYISKGSIAEVITLLTVASRLNLTSQEKADKLIDQLVMIDNSVYRFINTLDNQSKQS